MANPFLILVALYSTPSPKNMQFGRAYGINVCMDIFHILSLSIFCPLDYNA